MSTVTQTERRAPGHRSTSARHVPPDSLFSRAGAVSRRARRPSSLTQAQIRVRRATQLARAARAPAPAIASRARARPRSSAAVRAFKPTAPTRRTSSPASAYVSRSSWPRQRAPQRSHRSLVSRTRSRPSLRRAAGCCGGRSCSWRSGAHLFSSS